MALSLTSSRIGFQICSIKNQWMIFGRNLQDWKVPSLYEKVEFPERNKLKYVDRVPTYPTGIKIPKMQKRLILMKGPELIHNQFIHEQYGIVATGHGRMRYGHFEMLRLTIGRKIDPNRMFAVWRIDPPWQPLTRKGQGKRMGGGKGAIDHYVTPIKAGRVIVEIGGKCEFKELEPLFRIVTNQLPFPAVARSHQMMLDDKEKEKQLEELNINPFTFKYIVQNNLGGVSNWISPKDKIWFGKYPHRIGNKN